MAASWRCRGSFGSGVKATAAASRRDSMGILLEHISRLVHSQDTLANPRTKTARGRPESDPAPRPLSKRALRRANLVLPEAHVSRRVARVDHESRVSHQLLVVDTVVVGGDLHHVHLLRRFQWKPLHLHAVLRR